MESGRAGVEVKKIGQSNTLATKQERKRAEEVKYQKYANSQAKGPLPDRTLASFIIESTNGAIPEF